MNLRSFPTAYAGLENVPVNVHFVIGDQGERVESAWIFEGQSVELVRNAALSEVWQANEQEGANWAVYLPARTPLVGDEYAFSGQCSTGSCALVHQAPDTIPPERAQVEDVSVDLVFNGRDGGGLSCPDRDLLTMRVSGRDDRAAAQNMLALAYIASTPEELSTQTLPKLIFRPYLEEDTSDSDVTISLGFSMLQERDGLHFRRGDFYCFAIALMDNSGNIGERSVPQCISTTDPDAPYTNVIVRDDGCGCGSVSHRKLPTAPWLVLGFAMILGARQRRHGSNVGDDFMV